VDPRNGSVPYYWTLRGTYMKGCNYTTCNSCGMDRTHSTWSKLKGILCQAPVCFYLAFSFPTLSWLLPCLDRLASSVCIRLLGEVILVHRRTTVLWQGWNTLPLPAGRGYLLSMVLPPSFLRSSIAAGLAQMLLPFQFDHCSWHGTRNGDLISAKSETSCHVFTHFISHLRHTHVQLLILLILASNYCHS